jgi:hypothetical protein
VTDLIIELTVTVDPTTGLGETPYVLWEYIDVDDPSNDGLSEADGKIIDPYDYNGSDSDGDGYDKDGWDNTGIVYSHNSAGHNYWEPVDHPNNSYALSFDNKSAATLIVNGVSKARLNVPNSGGDNCIVKATLFDSSNNQITRDQTGIMTVWKRINLETTQMYNEATPYANTLDCSSLNDSVAMAFVEFCVLTVAQVGCDVEQQSGSPEWYMGLTMNTAQANMKNYVKNYSAGGIFLTAGLGGWYCLGSAGYLIPADSASPTRLINPNPPSPHVPPNGHGLSIVTTYNNGGVVVDALQLPTNITPGSVPASVTIWKDLDEYNKWDSTGNYHTGTQYVQLECQFASPNIVYFPENCLPAYQFVEDNNPNNFYYAYFYRMGFNINDYVVAEVWTAGNLFSTGYSPETEDDKFQGRTLVFKPGGKSTISHELVHGLGMAHNCGYADYTGENTCLMTYDFWWLLDHDGNLQKWVRKNAGLKLCSEHIHAIRFTNLEEESNLRRLNW